jgi:hypothetical protein
MEEKDDAGLVKAVAEEFVARLGAAAPAELYDLAEIAAGAGDQASAEAWRDIARAAERLIN